MVRVNNRQRKHIMVYWKQVLDQQGQYLSICKE